MTTAKTSETDPVRLVRVRPVDGALVRDEVTRARIESDITVVYTRAIERRIQAGDLELVGEPAPIDLAQPTASPIAAQPATDPLQHEAQPYVDTRLTGEERRALDTEITRARSKSAKETDR